MFSKQPITYVALDEVTNQVNPIDKIYKTITEVKRLSTEINIIPPKIINAKLYLRKKLN